MRSLALLPAQKIFAPLRLYRQRYILRLKNTSFGCRQLINKTQLRSAAAPALSSSVAVALCLPLPGAARPLLSAAATVLLSSPPPSLSSCSSPRISCRHPTPSSPSPLSFPFRLLIVVLSGGQSRCYRRWCRRCRHACPLSSVAFVVRPRSLSPLPMADVITSPLPSQPALQRHRRRRRFLPSPSRRRRRWNNARSPSSPPPPPPLGTTPTFVCASSSSSSCRRFPPPHRSRERRLPPSRVVLRLAVVDETSCSPRRDPEIPRDRTRCPTSLHRKPPPPPQSTPPTADSVESTMPRSSGEAFKRSAQTGAIARAARRTAWWNLMWIVIIGLGWGQPRD